MEIYVVQPGDTLYQISQKWGVSVNALQQINQFTDPNRLVVGQAVLIPTPAVPPLSYIVIAGDTLYLIAQLFNTTVQAILRVNPTINPNQLQIGAILLIPGWTYFSYTVRPGDTLYQIAIRYGVTVEQITKVNQISNPALINVGQILIIPQVSSAVTIPINIESFAYFQLSDLKSLETSLAQVGSLITYGGLFHYPVNSQGQISESTNTAAAVSLLKRYRIRPMAVITNLAAANNAGFDSDLARAILSNPTVRQTTIANVLNFLRQYGMSGVNVDFENMYPADRPLYTQFIQELTTTLKAQGYLTTIAVAPKAADLPTYPWVGAFDYAALGAIVDFIFLMTYEWGWSGGPPSPIAPIEQVHKVVAYATSIVPSKKLIMGVPLYGYRWPLPDTPETLATSVNLVAVYDLTYQNGAVINYDSAAQTPWFRYINAARAQYEIWFEDVRSVQAKYQLAYISNLRGIGYWSSSNNPYGFPQNWPMLQHFFKVIQ